MKEHPAEAVLALYAGGELRPDQSLAVKEHAAGCAQCAAALAEFGQVRHWFTRDTAEPAAAELARLRSSVGAQLAGEDRKQWKGWPLTVGLAGALLVALLFAALPVQRNTDWSPAPVTMTTTVLASLPLPGHEWPVIELQKMPRRLIRQRQAGLRAVSWTTGRDGSEVLRMTTADPNVVILLPMNAAKETHEN